MAKRNTKQGRSVAEPSVPLVTRRRVAYHEAGHAVAATLLRVRFSRVTIRPSKKAQRDGTLGCVRVRLRHSWVAELPWHPEATNGNLTRFFLQDMALGFAGWEAEQLFVSQPLFEGSAEDRDDVDSLFLWRGVPAAVVGDLKRLALARARTIVQEGSVAIRVVGVALLAQETLSDREVRELTARFLGDLRGWMARHRPQERQIARELAAQSAEFHRALRPLEQNPKRFVIP